MSFRSSRPLAIGFVTFATFTDLVAYSVCVPVLPDFARRLGASPTVIGLLFASFGVTLLAVSVPMGAYSDRVGRLVPLATGMIALAASTLMLGLASTLPWLFVARLIQGAADGVTWVAGFALIADLYGPEDRGRVMGYVMSGTSIGLTLGPSIGGWLYELGGVLLPFLFVALLALACAAGFALIRPPRVEERRATRSIVSVIRVPAVAHCAAAIIVTGATLAMLEPVLPLFFDRDLGLSPKDVGFLFGAASVASIVMPIVYGPLIARWGARRLTIMGLLLTAAWMPMLALATNFPTALVLMVIQWIAVALIVTPSLAYMAEVTSFADADAYGVGYGVYNTAWGFGLLVGPAIGGFLFDQFGFTWLVFTWSPLVVFVTLLLARVGSERSQFTFRSVRL